MSLNSLHIDKDWTLFLDRDGVINKRLVDDYVKSWDEFVFLPGVLEALRIFNDIFYKIFIVTNQQGIGKSIMSVSDLENIHSKMLDRISKNGGRVDKIYFCPDLATKQQNCRKPQSFMALRAQEDFQNIKFEKSVMAGDSSTDILFGKKLGMLTVGIGKDFNSLLVEPDFIYDDLVTFAKKLGLIF